MPTQRNPLDTKHSLQILQMEPKGIPSNSSNQQLVSGDESDGYPSDSSPSPRLQIRVSRTEWVTVAILCFVNLINYMDRFTVAGVLEDIQKDFGIGDDKGGLLQTVFVISYMVFAPLFGYYGDRYSRRAIMAFGVFLWGLTTLLGSFMQDYHWFLLMRGLVGIGEASYSTIAPTIISDLFVNDMRSKMLALFYFAIPVGSGLGYIIGSETARFGGSWHWGLRVTPVLGIIAVLLILFVMHDPERGEAEGHTQLQHTDYATDVKDLLSNRSFMWSTLGFTCVAFVAGALSWWGPIFILNGLQLQPGMENLKLADVSLKFGIITMVSGIVGVPLGATLAQKLRVNYPRADPLICAAGLLISAPLLFFASITVTKNAVLCYILIFLGEVALNLNWSIVADILLYVVVPTRRSTAEAFQILLSHALGDAGSPYLVGLLSEYLKTVLPNTVDSGIIAANVTAAAGLIDEVSPEVKFHSLQYALFTTNFVEIIGGLFFVLTALYIVADKRKADVAATGKSISRAHIL
ncbi:protein spinster isoform X2 [Neocloeon triangulifer]|uniref:protein spinster isoform X2 n=1 Tax=Neocloeon triangulifer TaxID=2078957 RepID=UPI00286F4CFF|nr:protein spinster isoform X2 [Neocloeon triangulifer]